MERTYDCFNKQAVFRTAEALGIQTVWLTEPVETKNQDKAKQVQKSTDRFLTIRTFLSTRDCIDALLKDGREIWATDLSPTAVSLEDKSLTLPPKLAIVFGREAEGCTKEMLSAAHKRVYLPQHGFAESLNVSVACALVINTLLSMCPESRGDLTIEEKNQLRAHWQIILEEENRKSKKRSERETDPINDASESPTKKPKNLEDPTD
uniref:tRNA/rRNA methyltransferase SpoU type domain-containing protein n=1 Tax=Arcella intermedia TaxID=1963864 RepID=A0A6B2LHP4_9EUKA